MIVVDELYSTVEPDSGHVRYAVAKNWNVCLCVRVPARKRNLRGQYGLLSIIVPMFSKSIAVNRSPLLPTVECTTKRFRTDAEIDQLLDANSNSSISASIDRYAIPIQAHLHIHISIDAMKGPVLPYNEEIGFEVAIFPLKDAFWTHGLFLVMDVLAVVRLL